MFLFLPLFTLNAFANPQTKAIELYKKGQVTEAITALKDDLEDAVTLKDKNREWDGYMALGWMHDELGNHRKSIEFSNKALEVANGNKNPFQVGRSLAWLGTTYSSMGLYDLAIQFFQEAIEIGAPDGEIKLPHVWGLSSQELGYVYFKMGDVSEAKRLLEKTTNYARKNRIDIGVAEGGAHLAEIALHEGRYVDAKKLAEEAVEASERCQCSPDNTGRARYVLASVEYQLLKGKGEKGLQTIRKNAEDTLQFAEKTENKRVIAMTKLLLSRTYQKRSQVEKRRKLIEEALEIVEQGENELKGVATAELGRAYLKENEASLAEFYLENGLQINEKMFRAIDNAYITSDLASAALELGAERQMLDRYLETAKRAKSTSAIPLLFETQKKIYLYYDKLGFYQAAYEWAEKAQETAIQLLDQEKDDERKRVLEDEILNIQTHLVDMSFAATR